MAGCSVEADARLADMTSMKGESMPDSASSDGCSSLHQDLILFVYDDLPAEQMGRLDTHLSTCKRCLDQVTSIRSTLGAIDRAGIPQALAESTPVDWAAEWRRLRARLEGFKAEVGGVVDIGSMPRRAADARQGSTRPVLSPLLKAAAVILLAGASFVIGRNWESLSPALGWADSDRQNDTRALPSDEGMVVPQDVEARMRYFSELTHGYLNRSRFVLLELANGHDAGDAAALREASITLLGETRAAKRVAGQLADPRIKDLMTRVEGILTELSQLSDKGDPATVDRIRTEVNNSGVLTQLELLSTGPARLAQERS